MKSPNSPNFLLSIMKNYNNSNIDSIYDVKIDIKTSKKEKCEFGELFWNFEKFLKQKNIQFENIFRINFINHGCIKISIFDYCEYTENSEIQFGKIIKLFALESNSKWFYYLYIQKYTKFTENVFDKLIEQDEFIFLNIDFITNILFVKDNIVLINFSIFN
jgi:hypothetical protein